MHFATTVKCALYAKRYGFDARTLGKSSSRAQENPNPANEVTVSDGGCC